MILQRGVFFSSLMWVNVFSICNQNRTSGLPRNWTDPTPGAVTADSFKRLFPQQPKARLQALMLNSEFLLLG